MAEKINWSYVIQALNGPSISGADSLEVDAYDKIEVTIAKDKDQEVNLVPTPAMSLLVIKPFINPTAPDKYLSYKVGTKDVNLDGPHLFIGAGAVSLLDGATSLTFTNDTGDEAVLIILIGRDATP